MTDRELLELSALASGLTVCCYSDSEKALIIYSGFGDDTDPWNPLENSSDAMRLAVKLKIKGINFYPAIKQVTVTYHNPKDDVPEGFVIEDYGDNEYAAVRRAIVRAAAKIGKMMKEAS